MKIHLPATSILQYSTPSAARISLILLLTVLLVFSNGMAFAVTYTCSGTTTWQTSGASLPFPLETFNAVTNGSRMYVIGGYDGVDKTFPPNVYHKSLSAIATSAMSTNWFSNPLWTDSATGQVVGLSRDLCGKTYTNSSGTTYIYTVGGVYFDSNTDPTYGNTTADVWFAAINNSNGNVGTWTQTSSLPLPLQLHGTVILNGYMYVIGGSSDPHGDTNVNLNQYRQVAVHYAPINADGSLGVWDDPTKPSLPNVTSPGNLLYKTCPIAANGRIYVSGGEDAGSALSQVVYATPLTSGSNAGTFSTWSPTNSIKSSDGIVRTDAAQAVVYFNGDIDLIAGDQTGIGGNTNCVFQGVVNASTGAVTWSTPSMLPINVSRNAGAASSSNMFSLGGLTGNPSSDIPTIYYLP